MPALNSLRGNRGINGDHGAGDASLRTFRLTRASDCSTRDLSRAPQQQVTMLLHLCALLKAIQMPEQYVLYILSASPQQKE